MTAPVRRQEPAGLVDVAVGPSRRAGGDRCSWSSHKERQRDFFPLPLLPNAALDPSVRRSRVCKQRVCRRIIQRARANEVAEALNEIYQSSGGVGTVEATTDENARPRTTAGHRQALQRILQASDRFHKLIDVEAVSSHEAVAEFLGITIDNSSVEESADVVSYVRELVSRL